MLARSGRVIYDTKSGFKAVLVEGKSLDITLPGGTKVVLTKHAKATWEQLKSRVDFQVQ